MSTPPNDPPKTESSRPKNLLADMVERLNATLRASGCTVTEGLPRTGRSIATFVPAKRKTAVDRPPTDAASEVPKDRERTDETSQTSDTERP
jgi:hypothetical protein